MLWPGYVKKLLLCSSELKVGYDKTAVHVGFLTNAKWCRPNLDYGQKTAHVTCILTVGSVSSLRVCTWLQGGASFGELGAAYVPCRASPILTGEIGTTLKPNTWDWILQTYLGRPFIMRYIFR